jgi:pseudouridine-5'-phosphate glycosidase
VTRRATSDAQRESDGLSPIRARGSWANGADRPAVALETAVVTHGVPREPLRRRPAAADALWDPDGATNLELARLLVRTVAAEGAEPVVIGVLRGQLCVGMDEDELAQLAGDELARKASARDVAAVLASGGSAGLTVAGTLLGCRLGGAVAGPAMAGNASAIRVFATGGIGGAHRDWQRSGDVSADLRALAESPVCVVCAGAKSILDLPATLEMLDTLGVPVVGFGTDFLPRFVSPPDPRLPLPSRVDDVESLARVCRLHWDALGQRSAVLLTNPAPERFAIDAETFESATRVAESAAAASGVKGPEVTPRLLAEIAKRTDGRSLEANIAVLVSNARLAGRLAVALAASKSMSTPPRATR